MLTGAQVRAARALLNISVTRLAELTGLAVNTIRRAEATNGISPLTEANIQLIRNTFESAGVSFLAGSAEGGVGVRFEKGAVPDLQKRRRDS